MDIYVTEFHPFYQVWVDGMVYDTFQTRFGQPLTLSQQLDIATGYQEALSAVQ